MWIDWNYYFRLPYWTMHQCACLLLNFNPKHLVDEETWGRNKHNYKKDDESLRFDNIFEDFHSNYEYDEGEEILEYSEIIEYILDKTQIITDNLTPYVLTKTLQPDVDDTLFDYNDEEFDVADDLDKIDILKFINLVLTEGVLAGWISDSESEEEDEDEDELSEGEEENDLGESSDDVEDEQEDDVEDEEDDCGGIRIPEAFIIFAKNNNPAPVREKRDTKNKLRSDDLVNWVKETGYTSGKRDEDIFDELYKRNARLWLSLDTFRRWISSDEGKEVIHLLPNNYR